MKPEHLKRRFIEGRKLVNIKPEIEPSLLGETGDETLSIIELLKGTWSSPAQGWNLIALPFKDPGAPFNYRLLVNQYGETLRFGPLADINVPNRGIVPDDLGSTDQLIDGVTYEQIISQISADDFPQSTLKSPNNKPIHHEPGFFLQMINHISSQGNDKFRIARLASIPHGDSVLAMGTANEIQGRPDISDLNALPLRVDGSVDTDPYLGPYKHFEDHKFLGNVDPGKVPDFPGFFSTNANAILQFANAKFSVRKTTVLNFDTQFKSGGILNIPFVEREANATDMHATFWIMELEQEDETLPKQFVMQYSQTVFLDFFLSKGNPTELIRWPHVSINTLRKVQ